MDVYLFIEYANASVSRSDDLGVDISGNHAHLDVLVGLSCVMTKKSLKSETNGSGPKRKQSPNETEVGMEEKSKQTKIEVSE